MTLDGNERVKHLHCLLLHTQQNLLLLGLCTLHSFHVCARVYVSAVLLLMPAVSSCGGSATQQDTQFLLTLRRSYSFCSYPHHQDILLLLT